MRRSGIMPAIWGIVGLLVILAALVFWLQPATKNLDDELSQAREELPRLMAEQEIRVGPKYQSDLSSARRDADRAEKKVVSKLEQQSDLLDAWFPTLPLTDGVPSRDQFRDRYTFYQDEIRREIAGIARARRGAADMEIPLWEPPFIAGTRAPNDLAEMKTAQRTANIERLLLRAAARGNAFPRGPIEIKKGFSAVRGSKYSESRVFMQLAMPAQDLHGALRAICELDGEGPIVRLEGLTTRPRPLPKQIEEDTPLLIEADVRLVLATYRK